MIRHAVTTGAGCFVCMICSRFLDALMEAHLPYILNFFYKATEVFCYYTNLPYPPEYVNLIMIGSAAGVIWGMCFSFIHK